MTTNRESTAIITERTSNKTNQKKSAVQSSKSPQGYISNPAVSNAVVSQIKDKLSKKINSTENERMNQRPQTYFNYADSNRQQWTSNWQVNGERVQGDQRDKTERVGQKKEEKKKQKTEDFEPGEMVDDQEEIGDAETAEEHSRKMVHLEDEKRKAAKQLEKELYLNCFFKGPPEIQRKQSQLKLDTTSSPEEISQRKKVKVLKSGSPQAFNPQQQQQLHKFKQQPLLPQQTQKSHKPFQPYTPPISSSPSPSQISSKQPLQSSKTTFTVGSYNQFTMGNYGPYLQNRSVKYSPYISTSDNIYKQPRQSANPPANSNQNQNRNISMNPSNTQNKVNIPNVQYQPMALQNALYQSYAQGMTKGSNILKEGEEVKSESTVEIIADEEEKTAKSPNTRVQSNKNDKTQSQGFDYSRDQMKRIFQSRKAQGPQMLNFGAKSEPQPNKGSSPTRTNTQEDMWSRLERHSANGFSGQMDIESDGYGNDLIQFEQDFQRMQIQEQQPMRQWVLEYTNINGQKIKQYFMGVPSNWGLCFK